MNKYFEISLFLFCFHWVFECAQNTTVDIEFHILFPKYFQAKSLHFVIQSIVLSALAFSYYRRVICVRQRENQFLNERCQWWLIQNNRFYVHSHSHSLFNRLEEETCSIQSIRTISTVQCAWKYISLVIFRVFHIQCILCCSLCMCLCVFCHLFYPKMGKSYSYSVSPHKSKMLNLKCHWHTKPNDIRLAIILIMTEQHIYEILKYIECMNEWMKPHGKLYSIGRPKETKTNGRRNIQKRRRHSKHFICCCCCVVAFFPWNVVFSHCYSQRNIYKTVIIRIHSTHISTQMSETTR